MTAKMNGGSMLKGAILGMNINLFNHGWITNAQGENVYMLDDVVVNGRMWAFTRNALRTAAYLSVMNNGAALGKGITKYSYMKVCILCFYANKNAIILLFLQNKVFFFHGS